MTSAQLHPGLDTLGIDHHRLQRLVARVHADIDTGRCNGAALIVARHGEIALDLCAGFADRANRTPLRHDAVFHLMSVSKALTAVLTLALVEEGAFRLTTPIADVIPEFAQAGKREINVYHILTQTSGLPIDTPGVPFDVIADLARYAAVTFDKPPLGAPGSVVAYSVLVAHSVLGLFIERATGCAFTDLMQERLFGPLRMRDTAYGPRADLMARRCPLAPAAYLEAPERRAAFELALSHIERISGYATHPGSVAPGGGAFSTAHDLHRFTDMLRRGGELDGAQVLSPQTVRLIARNHTGQLPNQLFPLLFGHRHWSTCPAYLALGFWGRGDSPTPGPFGDFNSPRTFGGIGRGTTLFWVDPELDMTLVLLTTGLMDEADNFERYSILSDLAVAAVTRPDC
ncbi:MAG: serine hydrolase domain-containing protein [Gammaproteobacteria bacterium]